MTGDAPCPDLERAVELAMKEYRHWGKLEQSPRLAHCFSGGGWLAAVFLEPDTFPQGLTKPQRDSLLTECFYDRQYHPVLLIAVRRNLEGELFVERSKTLPDFNAWCKNQASRNSRRRSLSQLLNQLLDRVAQLRTRRR